MQYCHKLFSSSSHQSRSITLSCQPPLFFAVCCFPARAFAVILLVQAQQCCYACSFFVSSSVSLRPVYCLTQVSVSGFSALCGCLSGAAVSLGTHPVDIFTNVAENVETTKLLESGEFVAAWYCCVCSQGAQCNSLDPCVLVLSFMLNPVCSRSPMMRSAYKCRIHSEECVMFFLQAKALPAGFPANVQSRLLQFISRLLQFNN